MGDYRMIEFYDSKLRIGRVSVDEKDKGYLGGIEKEDGKYLFEANPLNKFTAEELRQIADKLEELNNET